MLFFVRSVLCCMLKSAQRNLHKIDSNNVFLFIKFVKKKLKTRGGGIPCLNNSTAIH